MPNKQNKSKGKKKKSGESKQKQNTTKQKKAMQAPVVKNAMANMSDFVKETCSITNPFCEEAISARWPDDSYTKSIGYPIIGIPVNVANDAGGNNAMLFCGDHGGSYSLAATLGGGTATYTTWAQGQTPPSGTVRYRITCWGIKISCTDTAFNAKGVLRIRLTSPMTGAPLGSMSTSSLMADKYMDIPLARLIGKDLYINSAPLGITARTFRNTGDYTSTIASWINPGWQVIHVALVGGTASASAQYQVQMYCHYEYVFTDGDSQTAFARPPPTPNPLAMDASGKVVAKVGNFIVAATEAVVDYAFTGAATAALGVIRRNFAPNNRLALTVN